MILRQAQAMRSRATHVGRGHGRAVQTWALPSPRNVALPSPLLRQLPTRIATTVRTPVSRSLTGTSLSYARSARPSSALLSRHADLGECPPRPWLLSPSTQRSAVQSGLTTLLYHIAWLYQTLLSVDPVDWLRRIDAMITSITSRISHVDRLFGQAAEDGDDDDSEAIARRKALERLTQLLPSNANPA